MTEPNLDGILRRVAYWNGYDSAGEWERTGHEVKAQVEDYIANQVREARLDELERLELRLCKSTQYGIPVVDLQSAIDDRIAELKGDDK